MQRIINNPDAVVDDAVTGYLKARPDLFRKTDNPRVLSYAGTTRKGKVGIITGGGSGHEPAFLGYIGQNMLDAVAIGEIFSSPTANSFLDAARAADQGAGVACLYGNYAGDNMNVKMATKMAASQNITISSVVANDDVASAPADETERRRGVAGEILMWKIAGAAAEAGYNLDEVIRVAQKAIDNTRSIGIGLSSCIIPAAGKPNFTIEPGKMEVGIGHHGEPGIRVSELCEAHQMANIMLDEIIPDLPFEPDCEVAVMVSGLGATPQMELNILYSSVYDRLFEAGIQVSRTFIGNYFTSLEMLGATLTLIRLDEELKQLLNQTTDAIGFRQG